MMFSCSRSKQLVCACVGVLLSLLTLVSKPVTAQTAASGYKVSSFITGFANSGSIGPIGLAFNSSGDLYVGDYASGIIYKFGRGGGVASAANQLNTQPIPGLPAGMAFGKDGNLYLARQSAGDVVQIDLSNASIVRTVATGLADATALATDPLSGDLFVSLPNSGVVDRISAFANGPGTVKTYANTGFVDGLSFGSDGTLYAAVNENTVGRISGTNSSAPGTVTPTSASVPSIDGTAISANPKAPFLYGNRNDGIITKVDLSVSPPALSNIVTGGTRGDFVAVGPDGCLYATQTDRVLKITNADGTCLAKPLGPLYPSNPAANYTFSAFCVGIHGGEQGESSEIEMHMKFRLAKGSDGIDPTSDAITINVGSATVTIPANSFKKSGPGEWAYKGTLNGIAVTARLKSLGSLAYSMDGEAENAGATSLPGDPVSVTLTIGNDAGTTVAWETGCCTI